MKLIFVLGLGLASFSALGAAHAKSLPGGYCAVVMASKPTMDDVKTWITTNPEFPPSNVYRSNNEYLAITAGIIEIDGWEERVAWLEREGKVPAGSFCSARGLVSAVSPFDFLPEIDGQNSTPRPVASSSEPPAPDRSQSPITPSAAQAAADDAKQADGAEESSRVTMSERDIEQFDRAAIGMVGQCHNEDDFEAFLSCYRRTQGLEGPAGQLSFMRLLDYASFTEQRILSFGAPEQEINKHAVSCTMLLIEGMGDEFMAQMLAPACVYFGLKQEYASS